jgi:hypothetical protein
MIRTHCIPGAAMLFLALILSLLVCPCSVRSIDNPEAYSSSFANQTALSLPHLRDFDFVRVTFQGDHPIVYLNDRASQVKVSAPLRLLHRIDTNIILLVHIAWYLGLLLRRSKKW